MFKKIKKAIGGKKKSQPADTSPQGAATQSEPSPEPAPAPVPPPVDTPTPPAPDPVAHAPVPPPPAPAVTPPPPAVTQPQSIQSRPLAPAAPAPAPEPPKARIQPPSAPAPAPKPPPPPRKNVASAPVKSAAVVTAQGVADGEKVSTTIPGGIPSPEWPVPRSTLPKDPHFTTEAPYNFIKELVDLSPAGLLASAIGDARDLACAHLDENWINTLQIIDQRSKGMAQGQVQHVLGAALAQEVAAYQKEKYGIKGVTFYRDFQMGEKPNEIVLISHAEMLDGTNSRTGSWTATWRIIAENKPDVSEAEISGEVKCRAWCYEDGTAHMSAIQTFAVTSVEGDEDEQLPLAKVLVMQIKQWENEVMEALNAVYGEEMDGTLKAIRRTLPITRTRLKWDLIAQRAIKSRSKKK